MGYVGTAPLSGDYRKLDDISGTFNGTKTGTFNLTVGSVAVTPPKETTLLISVGGILQEPVSAYTVSGSTLTFTSAPAADADFFGILLGDTMAVGTPADGTISAAKVENTFISGQTEITSGLDAADELLYSDGGTIKRVGLDTLADKLAGTNITASAGVLSGTADTNTTYTGGTNLTLAGTTFNVDDAFLTNTGNDVTSGTITMAHLIIGDGGNIGSASDTDAIAISAGGDVTFTQTIYIKDDEKIVFGDGSDASLEYDENGTDELRIAGNTIFEDHVSLTAGKLLKIGAATEADAFATDDTAYGITVTFEAGGTVTLGRAVYIDSNGQVQHPDVESSGGVTASPAIGIATNGGSSGDTIYVLVLGIFREVSEFDLTAGGAIYLSDATNGKLTGTAPNDDGDMVQRMGVALSADMAFIMPSIDQIEHA